MTIQTACSPKHLIKPLLLILVFIFTVQLNLFSQNTFPSSGSVGIGTLSPIAQLSIGSGNSSINFNVSDVASGAWFRNDGVNTVLSTNVGSLYLGFGGNAGKTIHIGSGNPGVVQVAGNAPVGSLVIPSSGRIGIGTSNTSDANYKLFVETGIRTRKIKVDQTVWSDFVFEKDYPLPTLKEVEQFIEANKHLPGVPSAKEIENDGLNLGDGQALLLQKIEELTLYIIQQQKEIEALKSQSSIINELKNKITALEKAGKK
jgi:hypothetical protein